MNKYYITNSIPYVNAAPHIGHALEFIQSDTVARFHRLLGEDVLLLCGADENALKNVQAAENAGKDIQALVDENAKLFENVAEKLNIHFDIFQKGSDANHHYISSQKLWELCDKNGDIYKKSYTGLYCVGCEAFYTKEELNKNGECFEHPGKKLEEVSEENYFFKLSKYQKQLINLFNNDEYIIVPSSRKNEILSFLKNDLQDISISRSNQRAKNWGVPVPNDDSQRIYVWFDALNIYQSGIGFGWDTEKYKKWWPADVHAIGKGIIKFHAIYWPAILLSAGLDLPKKLFVHDYITVNGQKMSKTLGNILDPIPLIEKYGADAIRYYCLAKISPFSDSDFSEEKLKEVYNADLANGLGNLVARVAKLCENINISDNPAVNKIVTNISTTSGDITTSYTKALENYRFDEALKLIWDEIKIVDHYINDQQPWKLEKQNLAIIMQVAVDAIRYLSIKLKPFLPETAEKILKQFSGEIKASAPLFPRI